MAPCWTHVCMHGTVIVKSSRVSWQVSICASTLFTISVVLTSLMFEIFSFLNQSLYIRADRRGVKHLKMNNIDAIKAEMQ